MSIQRQLIRGNTASVEAVTQLPGQFGFDTTKKEPHVGDGSTAGGIRLNKKNIREILVAAQISANTNDYNPANMKHANVLIMSTDASRDLTGIVPTTVVDTTDGRDLTVYNGGSFNLTLKDQSASSAAGNRFDLGGADIVLTPKASATLRYRTSGALNRWELVTQTAGAAVAALGVIARTLAGSSLGFSMINGTLVQSNAGGAVTFAIKTLAGNDPSTSDPVLVLMRNATLATGDYSMMVLTAATSITVSSGSSLGTTNNAAFRVWLVGFNDAGTFRLGVINPLVGTAALRLLTPDALASSTAEGGAGNADSFGVFYTGAAVTSKPYAVLGYADYPAGLAAAGTWSTSPTTLQLYHAAIALPGTAPDALIRQAGTVILLNGQLVTSVAGSALTIAVKTLAGNDPSPADPVYVGFHNASPSVGDNQIRAVTSATSMVVSSGSTLGTSNNVPFRIWVVGIDDAGTFRLGVINCLSGTTIYPLGGTPGIGGSTAEGGAGAADSPQTFYTPVAVSNKFYTVLGYLTWDSGLAAAGAWSAIPSRVQLFGPNVPLPGHPVQEIHSATGALATGSTTIPLDDTIPQNTEGTQFMTATIGPSSPANLLAVRAKGHVANDSGTGGVLQAALFQDSTASAIAAENFYSGAVNSDAAFLMEVLLLAASTAATTFKFRAGTSAAANVTFNGRSSGRLYGGVMNSFINIRELMG